MGSTFARAALLVFMICSVGLVYATPSPAAIAPEGATALLRGYGLDGSGCDCEKERAELLGMRARIAAADTLDGAKELALGQTDLARKALSRAKWVVPFNGAIKQASGKLDAYEARVREARSPEEVAAAFGSLVRLASADQLKVTDANLFDKPGCTYTTGEIVVIVIGFFLAIIPGFIFMAIFC